MHSSKPLVVDRRSPGDPVGSRARRRVPAVVASLAVLGLLGSACSSNDVITAEPPAPMQAAPTSTAPAPPTAAPVPAAPSWPLTGLPVDPAVAGIPAVVVKVDNSPWARPHAGLSDADVVYELQVEGITRFMEVFHSRQPGRVGPVRSARSTDLDLLAGLNRPLFAWSGANPGVTGAVAAAAGRNQLVDAGASSASMAEYHRDNKREMPHNLFTGIPQLRATATPGDAAAPAPLFTFRKATDVLPASAVDVPGHRIDFGLGLIVDYVWDAERGGWDRFQIDQFHNRSKSAFLDESGVQTAPENVAVLFVEYSPDPIDGRSPLAHTVGAGQGIVLTAGRSVAVTWNRPSAESGWSLTETATGAPVGLTPGRTFAALPAIGQGSTTALDPSEAAALLALRG